MPPDHAASPSAGGGEVESIWAGMPRWAVTLYAALAAWAAAALPLMLTLGGWLEWTDVAAYWDAGMRRGAAVVVALAMAGLLSRAALRRNLLRQRSLAARLSTVLLGLPLMAGLLYLCTWQTAEHLAALTVVAAGTRSTESGVVRELQRDGLERDCRQSVSVAWDASMPRTQCISRAEADELAAGTLVYRGFWSSEMGIVRGTTVHPRAGLPARARLAHARQALNPLVVFLLVPASIAWVIWVWALGKRRFIYLGIILPVWVAYLALPA